jgi:hypothetical protein
VIENKQSGAITQKQREAAWQKLTETFNAVVTSGDRRTTKMLMEKQNKKNQQKITEEINKPMLYNHLKFSKINAWKCGYFCFYFCVSTI